MPSKKEGMKIEIDIDDINILNKNHNYVLKVRHAGVLKAGFFSSCSIKLYEIVNYFNNNKMLPSEVDSNELFLKYKYSNNIDITYDFFEHYDKNDIQIEYKKHIDIDYNCHQLENYKDVDYKSLVPFINKYFSPSEKIKSKYNELIDKYNIKPYNCIGLYYRGTDKHTETPIDSFESFYEKLKGITDYDNNLQIIIQTDSSPFLDYMKEKCADKNVIVIKENSTSYTNKGIHFEKTSSENYKDMQYLLATFLIISKCKYVICSSGNCSVWIMFYRNNANKVYQSLNKIWL